MGIYGHLTTFNLILSLKYHNTLKIEGVPTLLGKQTYILGNSDHR